MLSKKIIKSIINIIIILLFIAIILFIIIPWKDIDEFKIKEARENYNQLKK